MFVCAYACVCMYVCMYIYIHIISIYIVFMYICTCLYMYVCVCYLYIYMFMCMCIYIVVTNCGTPTEKVSEFLDHHLQPVMKSGKSYVKDTGDFIEKIRNLGKIPKDSFLVTADVVGLYPSIPHEAGLNALYEKLEQWSEYGRICS